MKVNWNYIKAFAILALVVFLYSFSSRRNAARKITEVKIQFTNGENLYVTENAVNKLLIVNADTLHNEGKELVIVSSGAIAAGMTRLGIKERPRTIPQKQAFAAVGQIKLMALYESYFSHFKKSVAQVLLTHEDLADRCRYLNAKHTLKTLLELGIIPIVNESHTI